MLGESATEAVASLRMKHPFEGAKPKQTKMKEAQNENLVIILSRPDGVHRYRDVNRIRADL
jgi:hypothetical protein